MDMDLEETKDFNISAVLQNQTTAKAIKNFFQSIKLRQAAFSTGFEFEYGEDRKEDKMFVKPKYKNLKEEVIESGYLTLNEWRNLVEVKAVKYWHSETVKKK